MGVLGFCIARDITSRYQESSSHMFNHIIGQCVLVHISTTGVESM